MSDQRDWGPARQCETIAPDGQQCALAHGHDGNHMNAYDVTQHGVRSGMKLQIILALIALAVGVALFGPTLFR